MSSCQCSECKEYRERINKILIRVFGTVDLNECEKYLEELIKDVTDIKKSINDIFVELRK